MMTSLIESVVSDHQGGLKWDGISEAVNGHLEVCMRERERDTERERKVDDTSYTHVHVVRIPQIAKVLINLTFEGLIELTLLKISQF